MKCKKCNHIVPVDGEFCPYCGEPIEKGNVCSKCGQELPENSMFCPFCGAAVEKENTCPQCGNVLPENSSFCPFCGNGLQSADQVVDTDTNLEIEKETALKRNKAKKKNPFRIVIIAVVTLAAIASGYYGLNAYFANKYLAAEEYTKAAECFDRMLIAETTYPGEYEFAEAGKRYESDSNLASYYATLKRINNDYIGVVSQSTIDKYASMIYQQAVQWYNAKKYGSSTSQKDTAYQFFALIDPYQDSSKYLTLIKARCNTFYSQAENYVKAVTEIIEFQDAKKVLVSNDTLGWQFLYGNWKTPDNSYYLKIEKKGEGSFNMSYGIPSYNMDNAYIGIIDGHAILFSTDLEGTKTAYDKGDYKNQFDITVENAHQISVYSYKSGVTYSLYRE